MSDYLIPVSVCVIVYGTAFILAYLSRRHSVPTFAKCLDEEELEQIKSHPISMPLGYYYGYDGLNGQWLYIDNSQGMGRLYYFVSINQVYDQHKRLTRVS